MNQPTIAMVTSWNEPCGIADYSRALVKEMEKTAKVNIVEISKGRHTAGVYKNLADQANAQGDIVHVQHEYAFFGGLEPWKSGWRHFIKALKKPLVITAHTFYKPFYSKNALKQAVRLVKNAVYEQSGWTGYLQAGQFKPADKVLVHSKVFQDFLIGQGLKKDQVSYYPQGIPEKRPVAYPEKAIAKYKLQNKRVLLQFGFLMPSKGHLLALDLMPALPGDVVLVIAGGKGRSSSEVEFARQIEAKAATWKNRVIVEGFLEEAQLNDLIAAADLCLFPYTGGTSSYALSIAMAHRKACVTSSLPNFMDINHDGQCLAVFETGNQQALEKTVTMLLNDSAACNRLESRTAKWVEAHHWGQLAGQHIDLYQKILDKADHE